MNVLQADAANSYDVSNAVALVVADSEQEADEAAIAAKLAGYLVRGPISFTSASTDLSNFDGLNLILIEAASASDTLLDLVLARADTLSRERALGVIATVRTDQIDAAAALLLGPRAQLLCSPTRIERIGAIAAAKSTPRRVMDDVARESESARLRRLNEEVARIAETLARLTRDEEDEPRFSVRDPIKDYRGPEGSPPEVNAAQVRAAIRARRMRAQFFADELFADPAWDMLLDLFAAGLEGRQVSVSSLCIAAAVPPTTALRWIGTLHEAGLFERQADPADRRRAYIGLSAKGLEGMRSYAGAVSRAGLHLV